MFKKSYLISIGLLFFLSLSGCVSFTDFGSEEFKQENKAVVFLSFQEDQTDLFFKLTNAKTGRTYKAPSYECRGFSNVPRGTKYTILNPGIYSIHEVNLLTRYHGDYHTNRMLLPPGVDNNYVKYGAFKVEAGDVLYFDSITYHDGSAFTYENELEDVKEFLEEEEELAHLIPQIKQGKFYKRGSLLYKDDKGQYVLVESELVEQYRKLMKQKQDKESQDLIKQLKK